MAKVKGKAKSKMPVQDKKPKGGGGGPQIPTPIPGWGGAPPKVNSGGGKNRQDKGKNDGKGKGGGGGGGGKNNNLDPNAKTTEINLTPQQKKLQQLAMPDIKEYAKSNIKLPAKTVTPFTKEQTTGQNLALAAVPQQQQLAGAGSTATKDLLAGQPGSAGVVSAAPTVGNFADPKAGTGNFLTDGSALNPSTNPALQAAITAATRPMTEALTEDILPAIRGEAVTTGNFGSSRQGIAEGLAAGRTQRQIGDTAAGIANEGYKSGLDAMTKSYGDILGTAASTYGTKEGNTSSRYGTEQGAKTDVFGTNTGARTNALSLLPQTQQAQTAGAITTSGVGDVKQAQAERNLTEDAGRSLFQQYEPINKARDLLSLMPALPGGSTTSTGPSPTTNPLTAGLGGAALGAGIGGAIPGLALGGPIGAIGGGALGILSSILKKS